MHVAKIIDLVTDQVRESKSFDDFYDALVWASAEVANTPGTRYEIGPA